MTRQESGYATITITAILLGLSIIAIAILNHASASAQKSQKVSERILLDAALEGVFQAAIGELINGDISFNGEPVELTRASRDQTSLYVTLSSEAEKVDINRDPVEAIGRTLDAHVDDHATQKRLLDKISSTRSSGALLQNVSELFEGESNQSLEACLRDQFTVFRRNAISASRPNRTQSLDGRLIRIKVESRQSDRLNRGVDGIVLFTGDRGDPAWTMDWRRYTAPEAEACK